MLLKEGIWRNIVRLTTPRSSGTMASGEPPADASHVHPASFRDPCAFVFSCGGSLYRQINESGRRDYEQLMRSGLYEKLTAAGDLVRHDETANALSPDGRAFKVIQPERIQFISYP